MGLIKIIDHIKDCYSNSDGFVIKQLIKDSFSKKDKVVISFDGINSASTSFVNSAFIDLLEIYTFEYIRTNISFIDSSKSINEVIKRRFDFEVNRRKNLINA